MKSIIIIFLLILSSIISVVGLNTIASKINSSLMFCKQIDIDAPSSGGSIGGCGPLPNKLYNS